MSTDPVAEIPLASEMVDSTEFGPEGLLYTAKSGRWFSRDSALNYSFLEISVC
jgi:hypothetical protein